MTPQTTPFLEQVNKCVLTQTQRETELNSFPHFGVQTRIGIRSLIETPSVPWSVTRIRDSSNINDPQLQYIIYFNA